MNMFGLSVDVIILILLLACSAFFAASEVAFLSISNLKMHQLLERKEPGAESLARLRHNRRRVIISMLIGNNIVNVSASALGTSIAIGMFGDAGIGIAVGVIFFLTLTLGEIAPKSAAATYSEQLALGLAPIIELFYAISFPLVLFFEFINRLIPGIYAKATGIEKFTEEEVRSAVKLGAEHKSISAKERELIENVLEFKDRTVFKAMTPSANVITFDADMPVNEAHKKAVESKYSRFPVLKNEELIGTVSVKILGWAMHARPGAKVSDLVWKPVKVKQSDSVGAAFNVLQNMGHNIAIVVDGKDRFVGVVTLGDLLEELVGEIQ